MAKFFVGQRVRILRSDNWPDLAGCEGVIVGPADETRLSVGPCGSWYVKPDLWASYQSPIPGIHGGGLFAPNHGYIEPILPEGAAPSEFSFSELMDDLMVKMEGE